jgi:MFS family permease
MDTPAGRTATAEAPEPEHGWRELFLILRFWNGRLYIASQFLYSVAVWTSRVAVDWLILQLTGDIAMVGLAAVLQLLPSLLFGAWAGVLADRYTRRSVLVLSQGVYTVSLAILSVLVILGRAEVWQLFAVCALSGLALALDGPARLAFLPEVVGIARLRSALSLNSMVINLGGMIAPAAGGFVIAIFGEGWALSASAVVGVIVVTSLALIRSRELAVAPRAPRSRGQLREAIGYCLSRPTILWPLLLITVVSAFGFALTVLLAASATPDGFDIGSAGYGLFMSLTAIGAMAGAFLMARRRALRLRGLLVATLLIGASTIAIGLSSWLPLFLVFLVALGASRAIHLIGAEMMIQLSTYAEIRGRVMSFYFLVAVLGQAAGSILLGWIAQAFGLTLAFLVAGSALLLVATVAAIVLARRHRLGLLILIGPRPKIQIVSQRSEQP